MPATPLYEFGYGLSYTKFEYSNLHIEPKETGVEGDIVITADIKNTGARRGDEVAQLYINDEISSTSKPAKELKGYERIGLEPGEKKTVKFKLLPEDISLFDRSMNFIVEPGTFKVMIGSSSEDIRLTGEFEIKR